ncbi:MAG: glycosyltransferase [Candidatus Azobacteroides sp.]|nr:glycosyltransferase [Candidatus Azobacteroides sp.]
MDKKLAVIMSIYKNDKLQYVTRSINSILEQTYSDFDFYIQIDGIISAEVENYLDNIKDTRLILYKRDVNKGLASSLNELLSRVLIYSYSYIARMDADDESLSMRFEKQINYFKEHEDIDCLGTWAIEINYRGEEYYKKKMPLSHEDCFFFFKKRDCLIHPTVMFKRSYFEKAGLYPEDTYFGEDTMMWLKGFKNNCRFSNIPDYLFKFRVDEDFFKRRRGWKHAKSIFKLRYKVNKALNYGIIAYLYSLLYACMKIMPTNVMNFIYKTIR